MMVAGTATVFQDFTGPGARALRLPQPQAAAALVDARDESSAP